MEGKGQRRRERVPRKRVVLIAFSHLSGRYCLGHLKRPNGDGGFAICDIPARKREKVWDIRLTEKS